MSGDPTSQPYLDILALEPSLGIWRALNKCSDHFPQAHIRNANHSRCCNIRMLLEDLLNVSWGNVLASYSK